jgi:hypothetical protein
VVGLDDLVVERVSLPEQPHVLFCAFHAEIFALGAWGCELGQIHHDSALESAGYGRIRRVQRARGSARCEVIEGLRTQD